MMGQFMQGMQAMTQTIAALHASMAGSPPPSGAASSNTVDHASHVVVEVGGIPSGFTFGGTGAASPALSDIDRDGSDDAVAVAIASDDAGNRMKGLKPPPTTAESASAAATIHRMEEMHKAAVAARKAKTDACKKGKGKGTGGHKKAATASGLSSGASDSDDDSSNDVKVLKKPAAAAAVEVPRKRKASSVPESASSASIPSTRPKCPQPYSPPTAYLKGKILMSYSKHAWRVFPDATSVKELSVGWGSKGSDPTPAIIKHTWANACRILESAASSKAQRKS
jgi:hypothetical protein